MTRTSKFLIRGRPGSGKSTALNLIEERLRDLGVRVAGIKTPEVRLEGRRIGFKVVDISTGDSAMFASISLRSQHRVGRYGVDLSLFESVAIPALTTGLKEADVILIDEIGKMELLSKDFTEIVGKIWESSKAAVGTVPVSRLPLVERLVKSSKVFWVERGKAERIADAIVNMIVSHLGI